MWAIIRQVITMLPTETLEDIETFITQELWDRAAESKGGEDE